MCGMLNFIAILMLFNGKVDAGIAMLICGLFKFEVYLLLKKNEKDNELL